MKIFTEDRTIIASTLGQLVIKMNEMEKVGWFAAHPIATLTNSYESAVSMRRVMPKHDFVGRTYSQPCALCERPDRHPIHKDADHS